MKFKSIKQLEKEIEELGKKVSKHTISIWKFWEGNKDSELLEDYKRLSSLRETLAQTKEIVKMIEEDIKITEDGIRKWKDDRDETIRLNSQLASSKHFLAEIKGEEE